MTFGVGKRLLLENGSFQKRPFSRDSREFRESRASRHPPQCGKQRRIRPFSRDSREFRDFRDSRDFSNEKTPFVMTLLSGPETSSSSHTRCPKKYQNFVFAGAWDDFLDILQTDFDILS